MHDETEVSDQHSVITGETHYDVSSIIGNKGIVIIGGEGHQLYQQAGKSTILFNVV